MSDTAESLPPDQSASATASGEPAPTPAQTRQNRRATLVGFVAAAIAVVAAVLAPLLSFVGFAVFPILAIVAAVVMLGLVGLQLWCWTRVRADDSAIWKHQPISWAAHLASYLVALLGLYAMLVAMSVEGPLAVSFWLGVASGLALLVAQSVGAVQYLRRGGPPGTLPAHIRRLVDLTSRLG